MWREPRICQCEVRASRVRTSLGLTELRVCRERLSGTFRPRVWQQRGAVALSGEPYASGSQCAALCFHSREQSESPRCSESPRVPPGFRCVWRAQLSGTRTRRRRRLGSEPVADLPLSGRELAPFCPTERPGPGSQPSSCPSSSVGGAAPWMPPDPALEPEVFHHEDSNGSVTGVRWHLRDAVATHERGERARRDFLAGVTLKWPRYPHALGAGSHEHIAESRPRLRQRTQGPCGD